MTPIRETPQWRFGRWGEERVREWLEANGRFVVPVSLIETGGAPALARELERYVLPDLQAFDENGAAWWEVKTKEKRVLFRLTGEWRHGIDKPHWVDYLEVERLTGLPGMLAIVEETDRLLLAAPFQRLRRFVRPMIGGHTAYDGKELVYFPCDVFDVVASGADWPEAPPRPMVEEPEPAATAQSSPPTQPSFEFDP